jgi:hypothetical protein
MELKQILKKMFYGYFIIYTGAMFGTYVFCMIFDRDVSFGVSYFAWMALFSLVGDLPSLVFCSTKELTKHQWIVRVIIHFILLEVILLIMARWLDLYSTLVEGILFAGIIFVIYWVVRGITFSGDLRQANEINEKIKHLKETQ